MYNCEMCKKTIGPRVPLNRVVTKKRMKTYPDHGTVGWEAVEEKNVCEKCAQKLEGAND